ncbi:glycosyltransferase family 1 protein [bacterium]|nr:glycosyltransferase family 1 protein [bacterium]
MTNLVCISHLRWDFVWQRPQHLLTRFAQDYTVYFVEEPIATPETATAYLEVFTAQNAPQITIIRLRQLTAHAHWMGHGLPHVQPTYDVLLRAFFAEHNITSPILWLYTPMAAAFVEALPHSLLIFDAMDQLSAFLGAPPELIAQEQRLLPQADLVFTGGVSLYEAKKPLNPNTHCFPSGVDVAHYAQAETQTLFPRPAELDALNGPIMGFFGVIDERIDLALLEAIAQARPQWHIVMIGPVVKIDTANLPQQPNLHYLGGRDYKDLPRYLAYFDVALLPFAVNESTRYISPTKTLEYMAAHKAIVSTPSTMSSPFTGRSLANRRNGGNVHRPCGGRAA